MRVAGGRERERGVRVPGGRHRERDESGAR